MSKYKYKANKRRKKSDRKKLYHTVESKARSMQVSWRQATNKTCTLTLEEARQIIQTPPTCPYCEERIPYTALSIDHIQPRSRKGACDPSNLVWCDRKCNQIKGDLTGEEFKALLTFLAGNPEMKRSVLHRLQTAAVIFNRRKR